MKQDAPPKSVPENPIEAPDNARRIMGLPWPWFAALFAILALAVAIGALESTMLVGFTAVILIGNLLYWIGERIPVLRDFGLPTLLCILLPPLLMLVNAFPANLAVVIAEFTEESGFLDFYVGSLIAGSILTMPRALLIKAGARYAFPLVTVILSVFAIVGGLGALFGFGFQDAVLFVAAPVVGGGIGAGAVPMSEMYAAALDGSSADHMSRLVPAVVVANTLAILIAGVWGGLTKKHRQHFPGFDGQGVLVRGSSKSSDDFRVPPRPTGAFFGPMAVGLALTGALFILGQIINFFVPDVHGYAWTILAAALLKIFNILPESMTQAVGGWYGFVAGRLTPALLVGIGVALLDLSMLGSLLANPAHLALTAVGVLTAALIAGVAGWLVRMYFVETSVAVGLGTTDMGGTGDVAVVSASNRLELMPFMQVSSRIGGALVLLLLSFLLPFLS